jgi:L-threonylcarbamoyladenylate synthase
MASFTTHDLLIEPDERGIAFSAQLLQTGQLLAFPTETVYGLGANALNAEAVLDIFRAKGRPLTDPLIVHVPESSSSYRLIDISPEEKEVYDTLANAFWPGPLTMIVKASELIPPTVTANTGFVGIRCPKHPLANKLLVAAGVPVAAPSANRFGHVSPTRAHHVLDDLAARGVRVLNGESALVSSDSSCEFGIESTVLKVDGKSNQLLIYRQGAVTEDELEDALTKSNIHWKILTVNRTVKMHGNEKEENKSTAVAEPTSVVGEEAPGQAITHYSPDISCYILKSFVPSSESSSDSTTLSFDSAYLAQRVILLDYGKEHAAYREKVYKYRDLSEEKNASEAARNLFDVLRWAESVEEAEVVLIADVKEISGQLMKKDISLGVADRVFRAASGTIVNVLIEG